MIGLWRRAQANPACPRLFAARHLPLRHTLRAPGVNGSHWTGQVKGVGSAYWRIVGGAEMIMEKAQSIGQAWMKGIGYARWLEKLS